MPKWKKTKKDRNRNTKNGDFGKRNWMFTWNGYTEEDIEMLLAWMKSKKDMRFVFQEELGESGNKHLQGCIANGSPIMFDTLKNRFDKVHWEPAKNLRACKAYCSKGETRNGRRWVCQEWEKVKDPLAGYELLPWQKEILEMLDKPPVERKIFWYWSEKGEVGKTWLAKSICIRRPKETMYVNGEWKDIAFAVKERHKIIIFNIARAKLGGISYQALENLKDGIWFVGKYESTMRIINTPHVIVFANCEPREKWKLSDDRWEIRKIE